jgi:hypothetical protein
MPEILPDPGSHEWARLYVRMMDRFQSEHMDLQPALKKSRLLIIHPAYEGLTDEARAIYNGDVSPESDGDECAVTLPRVWRWEHHWHVFFVMEAPEGFSLRALLLKCGDRSLAAA